MGLLLNPLSHGSCLRRMRHPLGPSIPVTTDPRSRLFFLPITCRRSTDKAFPGALLKRVVHRVPFSIDDFTKIVAPLRRVRPVDHPSTPPLKYPLFHTRKDIHKFPRPPNSTGRPDTSNVVWPADSLGCYKEIPKPKGDREGVRTQGPPH